MRLYKYLIIALSLTFTSCISTKYVYFDDQSVVNFDSVQYKLHVGDALFLKVISFDPEVTSLFNIQNEDFGQYNQNSLFINSYKIEADGKINIPILGKINVVNLSIDEATNSINEEFKKYFKEVTVILKLVNFKVSILGEVNRPGSYYYFDNRVTLFDALASSGGMTVHGNRREVVIYRRMQNGDIMPIIINMTNKNKNQDLYYLHSNDVISVKPLKAKFMKENLRSLGVFFAGISTLILVLNFL